MPFSWYESWPFRTTDLGEPMDSIADADRPQSMSGVEFRAFLDTRPGRERWELIGGVPVMAERSTLAHNVVGSNLQRLLLDALEDHDPSLIAVQRAGLELSTGDHHLEPDVSVIDADFRADQYAVERAYLVAEIVSDADEALASSASQRWIELKTDCCEITNTAAPSRWRAKTAHGSHVGDQGARTLGVDSSAGRRRQAGDSCAGSAMFFGRSL
jgi:hypothetical protein